MASRRVGVLGMFLESNAFARDVSERGFRGSVYLEGDEVSTDALAQNPRVMGEVPADWTKAKLPNPVGSYRRTFTVPATWAGQQVFLHFAVHLGALGLIELCFRHKQQFVEALV